MTETEPFSVLFVCLGNICRSPAAEAVFTDLVRKRGAESKFKIDSAGTIGFHEAAARRRGIDVTSISRPIKPSDFRDFDLILAMDMRNRGALYSCAPFVKSTTKQKFQILIMEAHKVLKSWTGGYQDPADVFRQRSIAAEEGDEQESLMWAALEKLPTYDRMRKGIIRQTVDGEGAVCSEVDIHRLRRQDRKLLLDRIFRVVEEDNERFLRRLRDRMDRFISSLPPHPPTPPHGFSFS
ncbi:hypothetical protein BHM03_00042612 [Ensete ventricosum]|nr:hypothetical protein BHM03_00042612 [Ensete ventricosum]